MNVEIPVNLSVNFPQLMEFLFSSGITTIAETLARIEVQLATFNEKLDQLEATLNAFNEREAAEDEQLVLSKEEVVRLKAELAALQAQVDAGTITPEQEARFDAIVKQIEDSNKITSDVLPGPT